MGSELRVSERLTRKLQARELPGWAIPRIIGVLQYTSQLQLLSDYVNSSILVKKSTQYIQLPVKVL